jgi:hypothetical protein
MPPRKKASRRDAKKTSLIAAKRPLLTEINQWLAAHQKLFLTLFLMLSVLIRAGYYLEASDAR